MSALGLPPSVRTRSARRLTRLASAILIACGVLLLADVVVTLAWQEPVSAVIGLVQRGEINRHWLSYHSAPLSPVERRLISQLPDPQRRIAYLATREERELRTGDAVGRMSIPGIGASFLVVQGTDSQSLEKGPGHYPSTSLPGLRRTMAVAGHRTTFLAPFRHLDALRPGDRIVLSMPYARFVYVVQYHRIVAPTAWWITRDAGYDRLVLSACDPLFSAAHRLAVFARLSQVSDARS